MDWAILAWIQAHMTCDFFDMLFPLITKLGNGGMIWIFCGVGLLLSKRYRRYGVVLLLALALGALISNLGLKPLVARPRPCWLDESVALLIPVPTDYSFPSGHTQASFIAATVLTLTNRRFGWVAVPLAVLIAFSRLYLYVHFPSDVLVGALLGVAIGVLTFYGAKKVWIKNE